MIACSEPLGAQAVGNSLYGLQSFGDSAEVRGLVAALAAKVGECSETLQARNVANGLYACGSSAYNYGDSFNFISPDESDSSRVQQMKLFV